jgi:hypothetical protein
LFGEQTPAFFFGILSWTIYFQFNQALLLRLELCERPGHFGDHWAAFQALAFFFATPVLSSTLPFMSNQFAFAIRYVAIFGAGVGSLLAGASTVHHFLAPDLTLPPPPPDLHARAKKLGIQNTAA